MIRENRMMEIMPKNSFLSGATVLMTYLSNRNIEDYRSKVVASKKKLSSSVYLGIEISLPTI
jgi:hypothetical protein